MIKSDLQENIQLKQDEINLVYNQKHETDCGNENQHPFIESNEKNEKQREEWGKGIEFLFSCISLSVGLGNVWRFPFIAFQNGGGAFLIPYIIVLLLVGRPVYYLEIIIGQFTSRGCFQAFNFAPIMKGVTAGQVYITIASITYYSSIMAITFRYLLSSFENPLPWSYCRSEWQENCLDSMSKNFNQLNESNEYKILNANISIRSSAELYFLKEILNEKQSIENGIGYPILNLVGCLAVSWIIIGTVIIKGIQSSGKAAYFLGVFPYVTMIVLLIRSLTLPGALNGVWYFFRPQWKELLNPKVWYSAVTQVFFSLAICFGTLMTYASYNPFSRNVYKDLTIITTMDFCSSIIAGSIIFGILGNLALETDAKDISQVVKGGAGLAFISYPDAIAKFEFLPQVFGVLFFLMLFVLGIGSTVGMASCIIKVIRDQYPNIKQGYLAASISIIGFTIGLVYMTPGGQFILALVDFYGASFVALILAIGELIAVAWIYGVKRFCNDIQFMMCVKTGIYWRICWGLITPCLMISVLIYTLIDFELLKYKDVEYPFIAHVCGLVISIIGIIQLPFWAYWAISKQNKNFHLIKRIKKACKPDKLWGPLDSEILEEYQQYRQNIMENELKIQKKSTILKRFKENIFE
ncbi:sodium-dependent nutrient amino acid transporter 1 [Condylostylus longicornis]|uniref:sodium-dependent nutrient amino acid transporter 1 n=1 Tax=Condylostylus longicornis TaxID=2530218 RepID=UPI00244DA41C|nr:sodium-dependent nutrient amino acid transporter 1 [Condylostylus longicornis]